MFQDSEGVDYVSHSLDQELKFLQVEQDAIATRLMRLQTDDLYSHTNENERFNLDSGAESRGGKSTKLYKESDMQANDSALREDDFQVYLRLNAYETKVNRNARKLVHQLQWLSHEKRYDVWLASRYQMAKYQSTYKEKKMKMTFEIAKVVKIKLNEKGIQDEKGIEACTERYIYHLKQKDSQTRAQQMEEKMKYIHFEPYFLVNGKTELKLHLEELSREYGLNTSQLDIDNGQMFTY